MFSIGNDKQPLKVWSPYQCIQLTQETLTVYVYVLIKHWSDKQRLYRQQKNEKVDEIKTIHHSPLLSLLFTTNSNNVCKVFYQLFTRLAIDMSLYWQYSLFTRLAIHTLFCQILLHYTQDIYHKSASGKLTNTSEDIVVRLDINKAKWVIITVNRYFKI